MADLTGIVLAAGAGTRAGGPKALVPGWIEHAVAVLAPCPRVVVVLGAEAERARPLVPPGAEAVVADDWADGMSASLRAGLAAATGEAAVITLVDLPGMPAAAVERVLEEGVGRGGHVLGEPVGRGERVLGEPVGRGTLRRAVYAGRAGHPVVIGRDHWAAASVSAVGDRGAGRYLRDHGAAEVECGDLWDGDDRDGSAVSAPARR